MKNVICTVIGAAGSGVAALFGGWDASLISLMMFMAVDYITGLIVAGVFHNSPKTEGGALESGAGWKGLCRKVMILGLVLVAVRLDMAVGTNYIRDAVCIAFMANELISIIENAGLMGVPIPPVILKAIDVLKNQGEGNGV
jgi:toxin secretion/phage lysis holin